MTAPRVLRWVRGVGIILLTVALVEYLVVPQLVEARSELRLFADASVWLMALALALEAGSLLCYTSLTQAVLPATARLAFTTQLRIDLTGLGASHLLPGGGASAAALRYRLMTTRGVSAPDALATAAVQTALAVTGLLATFSGGVALALPGIGSHPGYLLAGLTGVGLLATLSLVTHGRLGLPALRPRPAPAVTTATGWTARGRVVRSWRRVRAAAVAVGARAVALLRAPGGRRQLLGRAAGNWLLDAACLWVCLSAYGVHVHPGALLAAYGAANLVGLLPVTPGGLGVVEAVLIPALTALGAEGGPVVLGVLTWRALEFWLPIPVAGLTYVSLRIRPQVRASVTASR